MPFIYKFDMSIDWVKHFLSSDAVNFINAIQPNTLLLYPKGKRKDNLCYLVTDKDLFPPSQTPPEIKIYYTAVLQDEADRIGYNLFGYESEGDIKLMGGDEIGGEPPILGSLS